MKLLYFVALCALPGALFAAGGGSGEYDILPRAINFTIFAAILYYLIAEPLKGLYFKRLNGIAERLDSIQSKLKESKGKKEEAILKVEEAKVLAKSLVQTANKEVEIIKKRFEVELANELDNLDKSRNEHIEIERRRMTRQAVGEVLDEMFKTGGIELDQDKFVSIVLKKVA
jgi:F-type H+-transporting ATPase subunit b